MENKEQNYSFNQDIIDALRHGESVWCFNNLENKWYEVTSKEISYLILQTILNSKWSLTKPKVMVKKKLERWANIHNEIGIFDSYSTKDAAISYAKQNCIAVAVPFTIEWEQEE